MKGGPYKSAVTPYPSAGMIKIDLSNTFNLDEMKYSYVLKIELTIITTKNQPKKLPQGTPNKIRLQAMSNFQT